MANGTQRPATEHDMLSIGIWINAFGKALIKKGVLEKTDITDELKRIKSGIPDVALQSEIDQMVTQISKW
jgi:hypothetical protein